MTDTGLLLLVLAAIAALVDWWAVWRDRLSAEFVAKPLVIIALIGAAIAIDANDDVVRGLVVAALGASLVGDIVLVTPDARFEAGVFAFFVAHLLYIAAFIEQFEFRPALAATLVVVGVGIGVAPQIIAGARAQHRILGGIVGVYVAAIGVMAVTAAATGVLVAAIGGGLFLASDGLLGWGRFVGPARGGRVLVHVTYHAAQAAFVLWLAL